jgi:hypothetical protein
MMETGSSGHRVIGTLEKTNFTTEARRHGENQEIQIKISTSDLTSSDRPLCSFVSFVVNGFSASMILVLTVFALTILGNFWHCRQFWTIGVKA